MMLALVLSAFAGDSVLAGVAIDRLVGLGVGAPVFVDGADQWRASFSDGFVVEIVEADAGSAMDRYAFQVATVGASLNEIRVLGADEAVGDEGFVVVRRGNVVFVVKGDGASGEAARLLAAVSVAPVAASVAVRGTPATALSPEIEARDSFGRLVK